MSKKKLILIDGDKGGVGKSQALIWVVENMIAKGLLDFEIIEADKQVDVGRRYGEAVTYAPLRLEGDSEESGFVRIFTAVEESQKEYVFVNLPAIASDHLGSFVEMIGESVEEMDVDLFVIFVADTQVHSRKFYTTSREKGLLSLTDRQAVVLNCAFSKMNDPEFFEISEELTDDTPYFLMPKIGNESLGVINAAGKNLPYIIAIKDWPIPRKMVIKNWVKAATPLRELITGEKE